MKKKSEMLKADVVQIAQEVRGQYSTKNNQDLLNAIRDKEQIKIEYCSDAEKEESLVINGDNSSVIYLPCDSSPSRDRFTIAHELGHYFLHREENQSKSFTRRGSDKKEWQANWFAAELLMPEKEFRQEALACNNDEGALARKFGVSQSAVSVRLKSFNKIS